MIRLTRHVVLWLALTLGLAMLVYRAPAADTELPNRMPEAPPYVTAEAHTFSPPFEDYWQTIDHPGQCQTCHARIFAEWNGSMMSNAWRDPVWRSAFLLSARQTSTDGGCDLPSPPDRTEKAALNPFARAGACATEFDLGGRTFALAQRGSLMDGFCSRCHMPSNYVDNVPPRLISYDASTGRSHGRLNPGFVPTSDNGTGLAFATVAAELRNTDSGKQGVACAICHTLAETRDMPFQAHTRSGQPEYSPVLHAKSRAAELPDGAQDMLDVPDATRTNLGYAVGSGSFRLSPHAIGFPERFGPLSAHPRTERDEYVNGVFRQDRPGDRVDSSKHPAFGHVLTTRAEFCGVCHDVTNPLTIKNAAGGWVGGFPIERTYTEWSTSRYADRPGNRYFDPAFKRDCQTCHMQQHFGQPGTAQTLYHNGQPTPPLVDRVSIDSPPRTYFSHHFVGGNAYVPGMIGSSLDEVGRVEQYPELSIFSFSSSDPRSPYHNAYWVNVGERGRPTHHARLAWDRLRHVLDLDLGADVRPDGRVPLTIKITNSGSGHNFPTGFPEGRVAWLAVRAFDLATGRELTIEDSVWKRRSLGVGGLTPAKMRDPNFPKCDWTIPAGSPDPYSVQFKAVASLGDGCPTLDLVYAHPLNLSVNHDGVPIDAKGQPIDRSAPDRTPVYADLDGNGDPYGDAYLRDSRLRPLPHAAATALVDRYAVVVPPDVVGPVAVVAAVYYQSVEAVAAQKLLGNLADLDTDGVIESCVLGGACDGRVPSTEPAVVEGAPPVPMTVKTRVVHVRGEHGRRPAPSIARRYPEPDATAAPADVVVKITFSEPVTGVDARTFTLTDPSGATVPSSIDQIGDGTWALFPDHVFLHAGETYRVRLAPGACGVDGACTTQANTWQFQVAAGAQSVTADTRVPLGFPAASATPAQPGRVIDRNR
jgi:hypothetical protein